MAEFYDANGRVFLADDKPLQGKFNFSVNGKLLADYVPLSSQPVDGQPLTTDFFEIQTEGTVVLNQIYGVGYQQVTGQNVRYYPFEIETFIDTDFRARPDPEGFQHAGYDDTGWQPVPYRRYAHGGERHKKEALYLRRTVRIDDFERAVLHVETVRRSADIYINGRHIRKVGRYPEQIDISHTLRPNQDNLVAVRVDPYRVEQVQYHMSADPWTGWFAGLMDIELTGKSYIDDVFAYADDVGNPARLRLEARLISENKEVFNGRLVTRVYPWHPEESGISAGQSTRPINLEAGAIMEVSDEILIPEPKLWTIHTPNLYKVHVMLQDEAGNEVDDFVVTTGLRTVSQEGGTFRINGRPEMLNGPLLFGHHSPYYSKEWFQRVHDTLAEVDPTRLISPAADLSRLEGDFDTTPIETRGPADDDDTWPAWTSPLIARGTMERVLGYGQNWTDLRNLPGMHRFRGMQKELRLEYLNSQTHAWFDFESEETIGQTNWNRSRGKPWHRMYSYEIGYDVGSIGRKLDFDEWRESQAWQALSAYESYRKKRWLGFDGMSWCPLRGGGNTALT